MQSLQSREILLVDDNHDFTLLMSRALTKRGFEVLVAHDADSAKSLMSDVIEYAIVDLSLGKDSGLDLIAHIKTINPIAQVLLYTGYASIATAVAAIKLGATNYLPKPASIDAVIEALCGANPLTDTLIPAKPLTLHKLQWEQIQRVLLEHSGNISAAARALKMHRRTLQRMLVKPPAANHIE